MLNKISYLFPALENKNYKIYSLTQLVSLIGTWIQIVAEGWLVFQLTNSPFWVGVVAALGFLPVLLFGLFAGTIVDRFPKRALFLFTQISAMTLALILGILTLTGLINLPAIAVLAFLLGIVSALDSPLRFALVGEMVEKPHLASAIALGGSIFNAARVIGPAVAGLLIAATGVGWAFIINGFSFFLPIFSVFFIRFPKYKKIEHPHPFESIKIGIRYAFTHPIIKLLLIYVGLVAIFGWSYVTIMPVIAEEVFHQDSAALGMLYSASGLGSILGASLISTLMKKFDFKNIVFSGSLIFVLFIFLFTLTSNYTLALILLFFSGLGIAIQNIVLTTAVQHEVEGHLRGRVMSIYLIMFVGLAPLGSFQIGFLAEHLNSMTAIRIGAVIILFSAILLNYHLRKLETPKS